MTNLLKKIRECDPRDHQLTVLTSMLAYGLFWLKFDLNPLKIAAIILTALATQYAATRVWKLPCFEWKSAAISGLSLSILMRSDSFAISLALACVAILSKFVIRYKNKHVFNPTNFALVLGILGTSHVWIVPSQWGNGAILAFFIAGMGTFVVNRAARSDVSFAFLATYASIAFGRALLIGEDLSIPLKRLQTGSLLVFIFFMISDPKTTPNSRIGRVIFGSSVAIAGIYLQTAQSIPAGLLISLAFASILVPLFDRLLPGTKYEWNKNCEAAS